MKALITTTSALTGEVLTDSDATCPACFVLLSVDVDGLGEPNVNGHHFGCYVPPREAWKRGATADFIVAPPNARLVL